MGRKPLSPIEKSKLEEERAYERLAAMLRREGLYVSPLQQDEGVADFVVDATATSCQGPHSVQGFKEYASNPHRLGLVVEFKSSGAKTRPNFFAANHRNDQHFSTYTSIVEVRVVGDFYVIHRKKCGSAPNTPRSMISDSISSPTGKKSVCLNLPYKKQPSLDLNLDTAT